MALPSKRICTHTSAQQPRCMPAMDHSTPAAHRGLHECGRQQTGQPTMQSRKTLKQCCRRACFEFVDAVLPSFVWWCRLALSRIRPLPSAPKDTVRFLIIIPNLLIVPIQGRSCAAHLLPTNRSHAAHTPPMCRPCASQVGSAWATRGQRMGAMWAARGRHVGSMRTACGRHVGGSWAACERRNDCK